MNQDDCIFCRIVSGDMAAEIVMEGERVVAFKDKFPRAPVHVLVTSREHINSAHEIGDEHGDLLLESFRVAQRVAEQAGIETGYRIVTNIGTSGGQAIPHLHFHVVGGKQLGDVT